MILPSADLEAGAVAAALTTRWLGRAYQFRPEVDSTNSVIAAMLAAGEDPPAGLVVATDYQSEGRGRAGRRWQAPRGTSLLLSVLLRPDWPPDRHAWLTMLAALATAGAIANVGALDVRLKWPNDVMVGRQESAYVGRQESAYAGRQESGWAGRQESAGEKRWRKVAGILVEAGWNQDRLSTAIVGIGINVNIRPSELPATTTPSTSLLAASGRRVDRRQLLVDLLGQLEDHYGLAEQGHSPWPAWNSQLATIGQEVIVSDVGGSEPWTGRAEGTDEEGRLLVRDETATLHTLAAGEVRLRPR